MNDLTFYKSSYSGHDENCVEVAHIPTAYRKSSYSGAGQDCVDAAALPRGAAMRDSKHPGRGHLAFPAEEWGAFLEAARRGEL